MPKSKIKGKGEAYQSWNKDQAIATKATNFKFQLLVFFPSPEPLSNFSSKSDSFTFSLSEFIKIIKRIKKKAQLVN